MGVISRLVFELEKAIAIVLSLVIVISLFFGVVFRYLLNNPLVWSDEVAMFALVWLTFIGASLGVKMKETAAVTLLMDRFKGGVKRILLGVGYGLIVLFSLYILYLSYGWLSSPSITFQKSSALEWPMLIPYLGVPVGFCFLIFHSLEIMIELFRNKNKEGEEV